MMVELTVRSYHAAAVPALLALAAAALGNAPATPMTADFWQWKHEANPFGRSYGLYAWDAALARAAGMRMLLRWQFRCWTAVCCLPYVPWIPQPIPPINAKGSFPILDQTGDR